MENEIQHLREKIKSMEEIQGLAEQQLQEADEEKENILAQLEDFEKRVGMSEDKPVHSVCSQKEDAETFELFCLLRQIEYMKERGD